MVSPPTHVHDPSACFVIDMEGSEEEATVEPEYVVGTSNTGDAIDKRCLIVGLLGDASRLTQPNVQPLKRVQILFLGNKAIPSLWWASRF